MTDSDDGAFIDNGPLDRDRGSEVGDWIERIALADPEVIEDLRKELALLPQEDKRKIWKALPQDQQDKFSAPRKARQPDPDPDPVASLPRETLDLWGKGTGSPQRRKGIQPWEYDV